MENHNEITAVAFLSIKRNSETRTFINLGRQKSSLVSGNRKIFYHSLARLVGLLSE